MGKSSFFEQTSVCTDLIGNQFHDNIYEIRVDEICSIFLSAVLFSVVNFLSDFPQRYEKLTFGIIVQ